MTGFRTIAPVPVNLALIPGAAERDPDGYRSFWRAVGERVLALETPLQIEFGHTEAVAGEPLYTDLSTDSLTTSLHLLSGHADREALTLQPPPAAAELWNCVSRVCFWLYDHGVVMVQLEGDATGWLASRSGSWEERLDELQDGVVQLTCTTALELLNGDLGTVLAQARAQDPAGAFLQDVEGEAAPRALPPAPLWVARTLVLDLAQEQAKRSARHWLRDVGDPEPLAQLLRGEVSHVATWLNYVHSPVPEDTAAARAGDMDEAWRAMRHAQYFYAALDLVDTRLTRVLAGTTAGRNRWELQQLSRTLRDLSHRAELVMLDLQNLRKYVTRPVRQEMDHILQTWSYDTLIEEPVRFKVAICDRRLEELKTAAQARAGTVTDVILLGIGVTSVLATALALSTFGRSLATDPGQAGYGATRSGLTEWFASQSADALLLGSLVVSALLVALFLLARRSNSQ